MTIEAIRAQLAGRKARPHPRRERRAAAVLVPLLVRAGEIEVLFIVRQEHLANHAGEIAFPGGAVDPGDASARDAALREMHEELALPPERVEVIGELDEIETVTGYRVLPVVGAVPADWAFRPDPYEVAAYFTVPLRRLRDPRVFRQEDFRHQGRAYPVYFYEVDDRVIWGATAKILREFLHRVFGDDPPASLSEFEEDEG